MADYQRGPHTAHDIKYHFVWVTKYRKSILKGEIALSVREIVRRICMEQEVAIIKGHVSHDHVHLFASVPPQLSPASLMQSIKGNPAHPVSSGMEPC